MKRLPRAWILVALAALVAVAYGLRLLGARADAPAAAPARAELAVELAPADVARAEMRELLRGLPISGSLKAMNSAFVKARIPGELQGLALREGDPVRAGQVVARIEATEAQARLKQARDQAEAARAQIDIAERQWNSNRALVDQGFISRSAADTSANQLAAARANHQAALAAVDLARKGLDDAVLRAPISGIVAQRLAQPGERVGIDTRVLEIVDLSRLELEATLTAADSIAVRVGQSAQVQVEGSPRTVAATVARINPSAQAGSRSVLAYLVLADATGLRQGLFAQGVLATGNVSGLAVPLSAVRTDRPAPYVQVVENGRVAHKAVRPGARGIAGQDTWVAVEGLQPGAQVILGHVGALREGTAVKFTRVAGP